MHNDFTIKNKLYFIYMFQKCLNTLNGIDIQKAVNTPVEKIENVAGFV
jgi:hypothetical protein